MDDESIGLGGAKTESETAGTCATCGRPLTQCGPNGECLRCLVSLGFLADGEHAERPAGRGRLTPGPLKYAHFEVEVGADGFPVELGAGGDGHNLPRSRHSLEFGCRSQGDRPEGGAESRRAVAFSARGARGCKHSSSKCCSGDLLW